MLHRLQLPERRPRVVDADRPGRGDGTAGDGDRMMSELLESPQSQQRNEVPDMETVGSRIKSAIERDR